MDVPSGMGSETDVGGKRVICADDVSDFRGNSKTVFIVGGERRESTGER